MTFRSIISAILAVGSMLGAAGATAQQYPVRPVRILVGYVPGGGVDTTARIMAAALTESWGAQVFVENRPGAAGNIATELTAKAAPDGYTLVLCNINTDVNQLLAGPALKKRLEDQAISITLSTPEAFLAYIKVEIDKWTKVVKDANLPNE